MQIIRDVIVCVCVCVKIKQYDIHSARKLSITGRQQWAVKYQ